MASIFLPPLRWVGAEVLALCFHEWCTEPRLAATRFSRSERWGREERSGWQPLRGIEFGASGAARGQENRGHARARYHFIPVRSRTENRQEAIPRPGQLQADVRRVFSRACLPSGAGLCPPLMAVDSINPHAPNFFFEGSRRVAVNRVSAPTSCVKNAETSAPLGRQARENTIRACAIQNHDTPSTPRKTVMNLKRAIQGCT